MFDPKFNIVSPGADSEHLLPLPQVPGIGLGRPPSDILNPLGKSPSAAEQWTAMFLLSPAVIRHHGGLCLFTRFCRRSCAFTQREAHSLTPS